MAIDENQHAYANAFAHQRCRETAERLRDKDCMARPDGFDGAIGVGREPGLRVIAGQVDRDRFVIGRLEERHDTMPVPCDSASTRYENEGRHGLSSHLLALPRRAKERAVGSLRLLSV